MIPTFAFEASSFEALLQSEAITIPSSRKVGRFDACEGETERDTQTQPLDCGVKQTKRWDSGENFGVPIERFQVGHLSLQPFGFFKQKQTFGSPGGVLFGIYRPKRLGQMGTLLL